MSRPTTDVGHVDAFGQRAGSPSTSGSTVSISMASNSRVVLGHQPGELGVLGIGHAAPVAERCDDLTLDLAEHGDELCEGPDVVRTSGTSHRRGVLRRKPIRAACRVVLDDASGNHGAEPFADVALQAGRLGDCRGVGGFESRHRVEQAGAVTDAHHQRQHPVVDHPQHAAGERLVASRIELLHGHHNLPRRRAHHRPDATEHPRADHQPAGTVRPGPYDRACTTTEEAGCPIFPQGRSTTSDWQSPMSTGRRRSIPSKLGFEVAVDAQAPPRRSRTTRTSPSLSRAGHPHAPGCSSGFGQWMRNGRPAATASILFESGSTTSASACRPEPISMPLSGCSTSLVEHGPIRARPAPRPVLPGLLRSGRHRPRAHRADLLIAPVRPVTGRRPPERRSLLSESRGGRSVAG